MKRLGIRIFVIFFLVGGGFLVHSVSLALSPVGAGRIFCGNDPEVYYLSGGKRYLFPNEDIYYSWYPNFREIERKTVVICTQLPIGGNVSMRPGERLVMFPYSNKVYAVGHPRTLRWVKTEGVARTLYGMTWNQSIILLPEEIFNDYIVGSPIVAPEEYVALTERQKGAKIESVIR